ncbi:MULTISPECIES: hypothetical protein [unclassified Kitasatospora]|uniref:DUF7144 family membrane protein n=1 Tax=unclassified Kitasatospora TaxID=2633591 RepID=UPI00070F9113|nr:MULTISPECIES: hypothetical protein [unclassified Kitasatospora]KQV18560.1 hypothetical protein ASC99_04865 [Kitasatospora sp. Root107]KRB74542.1 hypothetical protein ASE03_18785 [Kitasatospora sp. Root187]
MAQASGPLYDPSGPVPVSGAGRRNSGAVTGLVMFAGVMMLVGGLLGIFQGIIAIAKDDLYVATRDYIFQFNLTTWGWIHLAMGVVLAVVGFGVLKGAAWGRVIGIALVSLNLVLNFLFLPYYPLWSLVAIALSAFVVWALCTYRD